MPVAKLSNKKFAERAEFQEACKGAEVLPTKRQASKFRRGMGLAFLAFKKSSTVKGVK